MAHDRQGQRKWSGWSDVYCIVSLILVSLIELVVLDFRFSSIALLTVEWTFCFKYYFVSGLVHVLQIFSSDHPYMLYGSYKQFHTIHYNNIIINGLFESYFCLSVLPDDY